MNLPDIHAERILVLDFGSQYTQLIARRVREAGVYCEIHPWDISDAQLRDYAPRGIILSGGPESVTLTEPPVASMAVFELGVPVLGICYGFQTMADQLGGAVAVSAHREFGYAQVKLAQYSPLLEGIEDHAGDDGHGVLDVWMSHGDRVERLPEGFVPIAGTDNAPLAGMADASRHFYGLQFHPEVTHTHQGQRILHRFVREICDCSGLWKPGNIIDDLVAQARTQIGDGKVLLGLSGGVDSSVVAALLHRAVGDQLTCVFVDTGLLRENEGDEVMATFARHMGVRVIRVDAEASFLDALAGEADPEAKRKIIGRRFIEIFEQEANAIAGTDFLAQGTIYPDVIESAGASTGKAHVIKSHHNVGGLPETLHLKLLEPLRELFKDEVRELGIALGLPHDMVYR
ncbi:MAG: glutamine-hydrolyzing GMP synthase, partial [Gammaproteobacteria bacterium]|nr:glutamine-hydrolyzing GMP synthase [Gammaproteobacteria bacterium]